MLETIDEEEMPSDSAMIAATEDAEMEYFLSGAKRSRNDFDDDLGEALDAANADFEEIGFENGAIIPYESGDEFVRRVRARRAVQGEEARRRNLPSWKRLSERFKRDLDDADWSLVEDGFPSAKQWYLRGQGGTTGNAGLSTAVPETVTPAVPQPAQPAPPVDRTGAVEGGTKIKRTWYKGRVIEYSSDEEKQAAMDRIDGVPGASPGFYGVGFYGNVLR